MLSFEGLRGLRSIRLPFGFAMKFNVLCLSILARYREGISLTLSVTKPSPIAMGVVFEEPAEGDPNRALYLFLRIVDDSISSLMRLVNQCDLYSTVSSKSHTFMLSETIPK